MINKKIGHINRDQFTSIQLSAEKKTTKNNQLQFLCCRLPTEVIEKKILE